MKLLILSLVVMFSTSSFALTSILVFDDITQSEATFSFAKAKNGEVKVTALIEDESCFDDEDDCYERFNSKVLKGFSHEKRDVYFLNEEGEKVFCGKTWSIFRRSVVSDLCEFEVKEKLTCTQWYNEDDCVRTKTKYQVFLHISK